MAFKHLWVNGSAPKQHQDSELFSPQLVNKKMMTLMVYFLYGEAYLKTEMFFQIIKLTQGLLGCPSVKQHKDIKQCWLNNRSVCLTGDVSQCSSTFGSLWVLQQPTCLLGPASCTTVNLHLARRLTHPVRTLHHLPTHLSWGFLHSSCIRPPVCIDCSGKCASGWGHTWSLIWIEMCVKY